jgi:uncharacterized OB-fold protein
MSSPGPIPRPVPDGDSRPYWEGIARGELRIQRCDACERYVFYPRALCPHCHAEALTWVAASGTATIYSYTVVRQAFGPFAGQVSFVVAVVELAEGVRMLSRLTGVEVGADGGVPSTVAIGAPVRVTFATLEPGAESEEPFALPYFRLA